MSDPNNYPEPEAEVVEVEIDGNALLAHLDAAVQTEEFRNKVIVHIAEAIGRAVTLYDESDARLILQQATDLAFGVGEQQ